MQRVALVDGVLNINKPAGITSFAVVAMVKRWSREKRVGHAGTLDPLATGVLPVCLGRATRVTEFLMQLRKTYRAEIELGIATDTGDSAGKIVRRENASDVDLGTLSAALKSYHGRIEQIPPMFSALKHHGRPLYKLARAGVNLERKARTAEIYDLQLVSFSPPLVTVEVTCGRGTYIRSLANDLGEDVGCGAHLKSLVRLCYGPYDLSDSVSLPQLEDAINCGSWSLMVYPPDTVLRHWPAMVLSTEAEQDLCHGRPLPAGLSLQGGLQERCRAYAIDGRFLGVLVFNTEESRWKPEKVFC
jgi:tRNA pseudouridine55 synthase